MGYEKKPRNNKMKEYVVHKSLMVISATVIQLTGDKLTRNLMLQYKTVNCIYFCEHIGLLLATGTNLLILHNV